MVAAPHPRGASSGIGSLVRRVLTAAQERAIRAAMQTFVDDDVAFGAARRTARLWCVRCRDERGAEGFVDYDGDAFCNACATDYELARARGLVWTPAEFLRL